jgi:hypothetical protein
MVLLFVPLIPVICLIPLLSRCFLSAYKPHKRHPPNPGKFMFGVGFTILEDPVIVNI